jgi:two-component system, OmpR family, phosphate regulon sensor histidine kinase PhoR
MAQHSNNSRGRGGKRPKLPLLLMVVAILAVTGFQAYWIKNNYVRERQNLEIKTYASFRETVIRLQASKLKLEEISFDTDSMKAAPRVRLTDRQRRLRQFDRRLNRREPVITFFSLLQEKLRDSARRNDSLDGVFEPALAEPGFRPTPDFRGGRSGGNRGQSIAFRGSVDSIYGSVREVNVVRDSKANDVIVIGYGKNPADRRGPDSMTLPRQGAVMIEKRGRPAPDEDVLMDNSVPAPPNGNSFYRILYNIDSLAGKDSVTVLEVKDAYAKRLKDDKINVSFDVDRMDSADAETPNSVTIGFVNPATLSLSLEHTFGYMLGKLKLPILFSLLLVGITVASFSLLYRNIVRQHRLAELKNDFISNVTHELKTPIATVGVAIEALKNFNAIDDAARTREYLDISQNELQRLNLLIDKVLKLSIFERKEIELRKELFDYRQLTLEVMGSMRLQFEKYGAKVSFEALGNDFNIEADKLHVTSVLYNLLDNALKYSRENPEIHVELKAGESEILLIVRDNGIGIPPAYTSKVFEKFFRVPTGNKHNVKGYGLGLSYVAEVVNRHQGNISVKSEEGKGSEFLVRLPRQVAGKNG